jgi:RNA polymerase sigma factor (sigma-70 family)
MESAAQKPKPTSREWRVWSVDAHDTALRVTRDPEMAGDIAQEALLLLMRCYAQVRDLHSWLLVVLRRMAFKTATRGRRPAPRATPRDPSCRMDGPAPFVDIDVGLDVEKAMQLLPRQQRRILGLAFAGHSHAEIAAALGCEIRQVGPRLQRAYRALGRRLGLDGANPFRP